MFMDVEVSAPPVAGPFRRAFRPAALLLEGRHGQRKPFPSIAPFPAVVLDLLGPFAAAIASLAAGLVVFALWNHQTGADVLRETRREVTLGPGQTEEIAVTADVGGHARLRNIRLEYAGQDGAVEPHQLHIALSTGSRDELTVLDWIPPSGLERFGPRRAHHYEPTDHADHDVFVWEPDTDFVGRSMLRLRNGLDDASVDVAVRVAFVEHLTRMQLRKVRG